MIKWESQNQTNQFIKMNRKVRTVRKHFFHLAVHNGTFKQLRQEFPPRQTVSVQHDRHWMNVYNTEERKKKKTQATLQKYT